MIPRMREYHGLNVTFQVTEDCNLRCKYCYEVRKKPRDLPFEYAKLFIQHVLDDPDPASVSGTSHEFLKTGAIVLDFIDGDALMRPQLVDHILQEFQYQATMKRHRWANRWRSSISTNGTLFGYPEVRKLLLKYKDNMSVGVSVDGCPEIHNMNRSNSMDKILENWDWYLWYAGNTASTKATLNKESIPYIAKSIKFLHEDLRLRYINMNFIFEEMYLTEDDYNELESQCEEAVDYILGHCDDIYVSLLAPDVSAGNPTEESSLEKGWCGAGAMPTLAPDGHIYPCFRFTMNTLSDDYDFSCGDVWSGFSRKERFTELRSYTREKLSPSVCLNCAIESTCAYCVGSSFSTDGFIRRGTSLCRIKHIVDKWSRIYSERYYMLKGEHVI